MNYLFIIFVLLLPFVGFNKDKHEVVCQDKAKTFVLDEKIFYNKINSDCKLFIVSSKVNIFGKVLKVSKKEYKPKSYKKHCSKRIHSDDNSYILLFKTFGFGSFGLGF